MFKLKDSKQSLVGLVGDSFRLLGKTWAVNLVVVLIYYILHMVILYLFNRQEFNSVLSSLHLFDTEPTVNVAVLNAQMFSSVPMVIIGTVLLCWLILLFRAIIARSCWNTATTGSAKIGNAFGLGFKYIAVYFTMLVIYFVVGVALYFIAYLFNLLAIAWLTAVVSILCACTFYYIVVKFFLVEAVAVIDDCGFKAIGRAWRLVAAGWWHTLGTVVFSSLFYVMAVLVIGVGIFLAVAVPGVLAQFSHMLNLLFTGGVLQGPTWFRVLYTIDGALTLLCIFFTFPTMVASAQVIMINELKQRSNQN